MSRSDRNFDQKVLKSFGQEWAKFPFNDSLNDEYLDRIFEGYTSTIDLNSFGIQNSVAADFGAGSGRWTSRFAPSFRLIYAVEPSLDAFKILEAKFQSNEKVVPLNETIGNCSIEAESLDLAISLGVLHHLPDTNLAIREISKKLCSGGTFLCYLYYKLEDQPWHLRQIFRLVDVARKIVSQMPFKLKYFSTSIIAISVYFPLARFAKLLDNLGFNATLIPLHSYSKMPFIVMRNDALDRFGTSLEKRFNKKDIMTMLQKSDFDLSTLTFSDFSPFWTFSIKKL